MNAVPNALEGTGHQVQQDAVGVAQLIVIQAEQAPGDGGCTEGIGGAAHLEAGIEAEGVGHRDPGGDIAAEDDRRE